MRKMNFWEIDLAQSLLALGFEHVDYANHNTKDQMVFLIFDYNLGHYRFKDGVSLSDKIKVDEKEYSLEEFLKAKNKKIKDYSICSLLFFLILSQLLNHLDLTYQLYLFLLY